MIITALHRWPADQESIDADLESYGDESDNVRDQVTENHQNAWLLVLEHDRPASEVDFDQFVLSDSGEFPSDPMDSQAIWLEEVLANTPSKCTVGFYLHFLTPESTLFYAQNPLALPAESPMPADLQSRMPYESPD